jgi:hypothetical protein
VKNSNMHGRNGTKERNRGVEERKEMEELGRREGERSKKEEGYEERGCGRKGVKEVKRVWKEGCKNRYCLIVVIG